MWCGYFLVVALLHSAIATNENECVVVDPCVISKNFALTAEADIMNSTGCNNTHVKISWSWKTNYSCLLDYIELDYRCISEDGTVVNFVTGEKFDREDGNEGIESYVHQWNRNTSSTPIIVVCEVAGYYWLESNSCVEKLLHRNITCSEHYPAQPIPTSSTVIRTTAEQKGEISTESYNLTSLIRNKSASHHLTVTSSTIVRTTAEQKSSVETYNLIPSSVFKRKSVSHDLSGTQKIVVVITTCFVVVLVTITVTFVVVYLLSQKRLKYQTPNYCDKYYDVFEPDYFPVRPDEKVIPGDILSLTSNIQSLGKMEETSLFISSNSISSYGILEDEKETNGVSLKDITEIKDNSSASLASCKQEFGGNEHDKEECDMASQITETLDKSTTPYFPDSQECDSDGSNSSYAEKDSNKYYIVLGTTPTDTSVPFTTLTEDPNTVTLD